MSQIIADDLLDPAELMAFVAVNIAYEQETDSDVAVLMARRVWVGCERLLMIAPTEMQQGGVGRGSGFSAVFDTKRWEDARNRARGFVESYAPQRDAIGSHLFGAFGADARFFHSTGDCN